MAVTFTTPLMGLILPVPGASGQVGPTWASNLNSAFQLLDSHNHTSGNGSLIPSTGLNINADLSFGGYNATSLNSSRYSSLSSVLVGTNDKSCVYVKSGDLYYNNSAGVAVQVTSGSGINAASIGGIGGDYSGSGASLFYTSATKIFTLTQSSGVPAKIAVGDIQLYQTIAGAQSITIKSPASLSSAYVLTMPTALPASQKIVTIDAAGAIASQYDLDNSTIEVSSNSIRVKALGIGTSQLAAAAVTPDKRAALSYQISGSSGTYSMNSTTPAQPTNLSVSITTTGRPVFVGLMPIQTGSSSHVGLLPSGAGPDFGVGNVFFLRGGSAFHQSDISGQMTSASPPGVPPSSFWTIDTSASAGTTTYSVQVSVGNAATTFVTVFRAALVAYEL